MFLNRVKVTADSRPASIVHTSRAGWMRYLLSTLLIFAPQFVLSAQGTVSIRGVTLGEQNEPVTDVSVVISETRGGAPTPQLTRTDASGRFVILIKPRTQYSLEFRRFGFKSTRIARFEAGGDTTITVKLARAITALDTVRVSKTPTAVSGVVLLPGSYLPAADAIVEVAGVKGSTVTDSIGEFYLPIKKAGSYTLRAKTAAGESGTRTVLIAADSVTDASILLIRKEKAVAEYLWHDFEQRMTWRSPTSSANIPGEELTRSGAAVSDALRTSKSFVRSGLNLGPTICVFIDGLPKPNWPLNSLVPEQIASMEVYGGSGEQSGQLIKKWPSGVPCTETRVGNRSPASASDVRWVVIWTKR